ncbi:MAG: DUF2281 domain-containing protein [Nitrospirae bacterium]|nr:DUF2281 domain-containing protein [Nitrospirota bacterium]
MLAKIKRDEEKIVLKIRELPNDKRVEVLDFIDFLTTSQKASKEEKEADDYAFYLKKLRKRIHDCGGLRLGKNAEGIIQHLRKTRETIWKEEYEDHFGHK